MSVRVLVTNVEERASLAACRGLAAAGFHVVGAASDVLAAGLRSRSCSERLLIPDPGLDPRRFVSALDEGQRSHRAEVVFPAVDAALLAFAEHPHELGIHSALGAPRAEFVHGALDKIALGEAAAGIGLPPPDTVQCDSPRALVGAAGDLGYPVLVKPTMSVVGPPGRRRQQSGVRAFDERQLLGALAWTGLPCLAQRLELQTTVYSFGGVFAAGELIGSCLARYRRTWPPTGGSAAYAETIDVPGGLADRVGELLTTLRWEGVFEVEFLGTNRPERTIDFNPRLYGSLGLAISAGANLPALWCNWLLGCQPELTVARAGCRYRWEEAEARFFATRLLHGGLRDAASVLRVRRRTTHAVFQAADPLPMLADALRIPSRAVSKARLKRRLASPPEPVRTLQEPS
jgi:hypothetical protein